MRFPKKVKTKINVNETVEGETIEETLRRIMEKGENPSGDLPMIYTNKKDGVPAGFDIRTDRFEVGREGMEKAETALKKERARKLAKGEEIVPPGDSDENPITDEK
ncbi:hypothetical protein [Dipodfec virus UOA04_Rod_565]|nr:hypothetical protein [Dipodfec virus UOA04_Rod_565]